MNTWKLLIKTLKKCKENILNDKRIVFKDKPWEISCSFITIFSNKRFIELLIYLIASNITIRIAKWKN